MRVGVPFRSTGREEVNDTALAYDEGHSERLVGQILHNNPHTRISLATKIPPKNGLWPAPAGVPIAGTRVGSLYFNLSALKHVGRSSGREYVTPLSAYPLGDGFVFALSYGPTVDWCRNLMASGKGTLTWHGQEYALEKPELLPIAEAWQAYPVAARLFIRAGGMKQCLWMHKQSVVPQQDRALA